MHQALMMTWSKQLPRVVNFGSRRQRINLCLELLLIPLKKLFNFTKLTRLKLDFKEGFKPAAKKEQTINDHSSNDQSSNDQTTDDQAIPDGKMIERRKRALCRCGCNAQLRIKRITGNKYMVYKFVEKHNHCLVHEDDIKYLRTCRKLTYPKQLLLHQLSNVNLGPVRGFKVMKE
nr:FAR1 DNA binding domain, zinc finger, SWIM-type, MULE transposase domain, FHY3/FAR1 family [Tanacetum cinerariifolium]